MAITTSALAVSDSSHVSVTRRAATRLADVLGFSEERAAQAALIASELTSNIIKHAERGEILLTECRASGRVGIEILSLDQGRGFANVEHALVDGHSTSGTLGHGLGAVVRQSDQFDVFSMPTKGAAVLARLWQDRTTAPEQGFFIGGICVAKTGEERSGDGWSAEIGRQRASIIVADGLGHGLLAAAASDAAVDAFRQSPWDFPVVILESIHQALRPTRGAAVAVAGIDFDREIATVAGLGNVVGAVITNGQRRNIVSLNGTAGHSARRFQEFTYPFSAYATLVLHSDGLATHWNSTDYSELWTHDPSLIAGVLYRDHSRHRDDVTVVVARGSRSRSSVSRD